LREEVVNRSAAGHSGYRAIRADLWDPASGDVYDGPDVQLELVCDGLRAATMLPAFIADVERLAPLFREIDRDWRGWDGEKHSGLAELAGLRVTATHDGLGHVRLAIDLAAGWPTAPDWSVHAVPDA
jgi:hypothetical protein